MDLHELDNLGPFTLGINKATHEPVLVLRTGVGAFSVAMTTERATQLGLALIRATGQQYDFSADIKGGNDEKPIDSPVDSKPVVESEPGPGDPGWRGGPGRNGSGGQGAGPNHFNESGPWGPVARSRR
jgi:hypothetical protein